MNTTKFWSNTSIFSSLVFLFSVLSFCCILKFCVLEQILKPIAFSRRTHKCCICTLHCSFYSFWLAALLPAAPESKNPKNQGARNKKLRIISKSKENHTASKTKSSPRQTYRHEKENASMFKRKRADNQRMNKRIERQRERKEHYEIIYVYCAPPPCHIIPCQVRPGHAMPYYNINVSVSYIIRYSFHWNWLICDVDVHMVIYKWLL